MNTMVETNRNFARKVRQGDLQIGTAITLACPEVVEMLSQCGFDWLFIDAEHGPFDPHDAQKLLQAARCPCLIRLPGHDEVWVKKALDIGAAGIVVPQVNSVAQAQRIVSLCHYPPAGVRGMGLARAHNYGLDPDYLAESAARTAIVLQAEHKDGIANLPDIVKVPGVDAILAGPWDLSASFGKPGDIDAPEVSAAIGRVAEVCTNSQITAAIFTVSAAHAKAAIAQGFKLIVLSADTAHLLSGVRTLLSELKDSE